MLSDKLSIHYPEAQWTLNGDSYEGLTWYGPGEKPSEEYLNSLSSEHPNKYPLKRWQFKAMVDYLGIADTIETAINSFPDPLQRSIVMARYKESDLYHRNDPLFDQIANLIGLSTEDLDNAWLQIALN